MLNDTTVCVLGLGYIGLPSAVVIANAGFKVIGVDVKEDVIDLLSSGQSHINEPGLQDLLTAVHSSGKLDFYQEPKESDIFLIAVPTPFKGNFIPDISFIVSAVKKIAPLLRKGNTIILESTSPIGTTKEIQNILDEEGVDTTHLHIAHCPERVLPGNIVKELVDNDRIVGGLTKEATERVKEFYSTFVEGSVSATNAETAEMVKLTENSFRDTNIAFANEISMICESLSINHSELIKLANKHPRVNILQPGPGVGGHCIAVDPWFLVHAAPERSKLIKTAREINNQKTDWVIEKIIKHCSDLESNNNKRPVIACMGLSFKSNVGDLRESPALRITQDLIKLGYEVRAVEPNIEILENIELVDINLALQSDLIVFLVAHDEFKDLQCNEFIDFCGITS